MHAETVPANPFAMLLDPEATLAAIQRSERLARLHSRICRPLDRPVPASGNMRAGEGALEIDDFGNDERN